MVRKALAGGAISCFAEHNPVPIRAGARLRSSGAPAKDEEERDDCAVHERSLRRAEAARDAT